MDYNYYSNNPRNCDYYIKYLHISLFNFIKDKQNNARILIFLKLFLSEESSTNKDPDKHRRVNESPEDVVFGVSGLAVAVSS